LAETKMPVRWRPGSDHEDTDAEYIVTPSGHPTPEAAIDIIKQMIDQQMIDEESSKLSTALIRTRLRLKPCP
jgi:hypothetical protein